MLETSWRNGFKENGQWLLSFVVSFLAIARFGRVAARATACISPFVFMMGASCLKSA